MPLYMVHPRRPTFRRTIKAGRKSRQVVFEPGQPVELSALEAKAIAKDIGTAIVPVKVEPLPGEEKSKQPRTRTRVLWDQVNGESPPEVEAEAPSPSDADAS